MKSSLKLVIPILYSIIAVWLCFKIVSQSQENQQNRIDYAELNHVKYGMFSVEEWKKRLVEIVTEEFDQVYSSTTSEKELRAQIGVVLARMIDEVSNKIRDTNKKTTTGKMKQAFIDMFVDIKDVKAGIPRYTDAVIKELQKKKTQEKVKGLVSEKVTELATKTKVKQDKSRLHGIFENTGTENIVAAREKLKRSIAVLDDSVVIYSIVFVILLTIPFLLLVRGKVRPDLTLFLALVLSLVLLLITGIATPMIDMEAKISELKFVLIGHTIQFDNQVLYFQSKSILDVFLIMIRHGKVMMKLVGILLLLFSVIFPLIKILCSLAYYFDFWRARERPVFNFFVFKSGKWSMTDVMVVAIFMAYIGFNGIIDNQLKIFSSMKTGANIMTTNGTALQPGYFLFMTYAMFAIVLSGYLKRDSEVS